MKDIDLRRDKGRVRYGKLTLDYKVPFGKYRGLTFHNISEEDIQYAKWLTTIWKSPIDPSVRRYMMRVYNHQI